MKLLLRNGYNLKRRLGISLYANNQCFLLSTETTVKMKFLNVAEKNDAAKNIALHLSRGTSRRREGLSQYNKIYEFEAEVNHQKATMAMTSVSGHLLGLEFVGSYKHWQSCNPLVLFDAPVFKYCPENYEKIKKTLEREVRSCQGLIIWTDCDREGENIGFEIIQVCTAIKPNLQIYRAKFSEITAVSVRRALNNLEQPNKNISDAVDVRQELDLRIGAAFTRFQTLRLQKVFPSKLADSLVSYGSCQFPTLGFVVERYRAVESFVPEPFWKIKVNHTMNDLSVDFNWERIRLFDQEACQVLQDICLESPTAKVCEVKTKPKSKWRPLPLDTVELEKSASRKLRINAKETMKLAEKLYTQGFISYPRTETNEYPKEMNLGQLVEQQTDDPNWGGFARGILGSGGPTPRQGNKSDKAHPPIHPTKYTNTLSGNEQRLYEFIVRSFLACCSKDAQGQETTVAIDIAGERFTANGLMITARNYLDVYPYDKWSSKEIHVYEMGQTFSPTSIDMAEGSTQPPHLLTEADLIALMEKHGIGTDATHADHIETIKNRSYVALADAIHFVPGLLGMGLVEGYDAMGLAISKPHLRAGLEADLKAISEGRKQPQVVLAEQIAKYKEVYVTVTGEADKIDAALAERFSEPPAPYQPASAPALDMPSALKCPKCGADMVVRQKKNNPEELYIGCLSFPTCKNAVWFPAVVRTIQVLNDTCSTCGPNYKKLKFEWRNNSISHLYPPPYTCCIGGCDTTFLELLKINLSCVKAVPESRTQNTTSSNSNFTSSNNVPRTTVEVLPSRQNWNQNTAPQNQIRGPNANQQGQNWHQNTAPQNQIRGPNANQQGQNWHQNTAPQNQIRGPNANQQGQNWHQNTTPQNQIRGPNANQQGQNWHQNTAPQNQTRGPTNQPRQFLPPPAANRGQNGPNASARMPTPWGSADEPSGDSNDVQCGCNKPAIILTVRKQTANFGKQFYKCDVGKENGGCDFFLWAPDSQGAPAQPAAAAPAPAPRRADAGSTRGWGVTPSFSRDSFQGNDDGVNCECGLPCKKITVHKEGVNKGRPFYGCPKDFNSRCNFFQWADDAAGGGGGGDWGVPRTSVPSSRGRGRGRARGGARGGSGRGDEPRGGGRRCGLCRQEGHTRARCPNNDDN